MGVFTRKLLLFLGEFQISHHFHTYVPHFESLRQYIALKQTHFGTEQ